MMNGSLWAELIISLLHFQFASRPSVRACVCAFMGRWMLSTFIHIAQLVTSTTAMLHLTFSVLTQTHKPCPKPFKTVPGFLVRLEPLRMKKKCSKIQPRNRRLILRTVYLETCWVLTEWPYLSSSNLEKPPKETEHPSARRLLGISWSHFQVERQHRKEVMVQFSEICYTTPSIPPFSNPPPDPKIFSLALSSVRHYSVAIIPDDFALKAWLSLGHQPSWKEVMRWTIIIFL